MCDLADYNTFKKYKNVDDFQQAEVYKNPRLKAVFENSSMLFEKPLTISQVSFEKKQAVENHILMIGDTAGLIHPLCGNGMAMAVHSAKIAAELVFLYFTGTVKTRQELETRYSREWKQNFEKRVKTGRMLSMALKSSMLTKPLMDLMVLFPSLLPKIIKKTHGNPIKIAS
jgi:flavin-dependent dehydrogenase